MVIFSIKKFELRRDFTISIYKDLLDAFIRAGYSFQTYRDFIQSPKDKVIVLRHDVDDRKLHALQFAKIQRDLGIRGTYYFRVVKESYDPVMMREMESMGHEIGLHYEEMDLANGDKERAYEMFLGHLELFRSWVTVSTICMHGSPRSRYDNKDIWKENDYRTLGLIGEPYFDLDTSRVFYVTDTGMMWDGNRFSIRDRMNNAGFQKHYHATQEMISDIELGKFPLQCMMNFHPQRWHDNDLAWVQEKMTQTMKNVVKGTLKNLRSKI